MTNAPSTVLPLTQPQTSGQWSYFVARLQDIINSIRDASNRQPVNVVPSDFAVYNGSALPALSISGASAALDTTKHQFGAASLKLTATAATVTVEFSADPIMLQPYSKWIESVFIQSSRTSITGTLAIDTPGGSYPVDIAGTLIPATWGRLYGDCNLIADPSTTATMTLTLTGCTAGDTFNLEGWQIEHATGATNLPSPFVNTTVPQTYADTTANASEALANANAAQASANAANAQLADIASDNILSPAEKPTVIRDYAVITAEQAGIDAQATAYGVTTEKTAYDAAITALTAYLATLTTATAWNDKSGNTTVVGATFRANFNTVYTTRQTLLNAIYAQAKAWASASLYPGQNLFPNPSGALGFYFGPLQSTFAWVGGAQQGMALLTNIYGFQGPWFGCNGGPTPTDNGFSINIPAMGGSFTLSADMDAQAITSGSMYIQARFLNSLGSEINPSLRPQITATNGTGLQRYTTSLNAPSGTATVSCLVRFTGTMISPYGAVGWSRIKLEVGSTATPFSDEASQFGNQLTNAGSGQQVGDQRNLNPITWAGVRSVLSASPIAYTITNNGNGTSTVNFSVASVQLMNASNNPTYAASSGSSSPQTNGTTFTYYLFYTDLVGNGGSFPLRLAASIQQVAGSPGNVMLGSATVTVASGGGGGGGTGGGGGGYCVCDDMWIDADTQAMDAQSGHLFDCCDLPTRGTETFKRALQSVDYHDEQCVRITTEGGAQLDCGHTTPFDTVDGRVLRAPDMRGELVLTDDGLQRVASVESIGVRRVCYFHFGGVSYAAGRKRGGRIYSHNSGIKP